MPMSQLSNHVYTFGDFHLDCTRSQLIRKDQAVPLTPKVFDTLLLLVENAGRLVEKDEFVHRLWPDTFVGDDALIRNIYVLRKVLGETEDGQEFIATIPKRGYRFQAEVQALTAGSTGVAPLTQINSISGAITEVRTARSDSVSRWPRAEAKTWRMFLVAIIVFAVLSTAAFVFIKFRSSTILSPVIRGLAVLPLESLSGDPSQDYFADGLTDQLITDLSRISRIRVISRTSVMQYKGTRKPLPQIAHELNVDAVVEGTILKSGDQVRITAQLIHVIPERHLWSQSYVGDLSDVLALQQRVSSDVASHINSKMSLQEQADLKQIRAVNVAAYDAYLQGLYFESQQSPEALQRAVAYFQRAVQKDPAYSLAYVGLAHCYTELGYRDVLSPKEVNEKAKIAALKAFQLDQNVAETRTALASIEHDAFEWDAARTEKEFQTAIQLNPNYAPAHDRYSDLLLEQSRADEAIRETKRALELDPLNIAVGSHLADAYYYNRQYKEAIVQRKKVLELFPTASEPNQNLILDYLADGSPRQFLRQAQRWLEVSGEASAKTAAAQLSGLESADYRKVLRILIQQAVAQRKAAYASAVWIAILYAADGDKEQALTWLEKGYDERDPNLHFIRMEPSFDGLRTAPRFQKLSTSIGLAQ
jgi:TolB-like protein/DNA-binding winged helix-turn-helix (wHTH) protein/Flp pilus assembly protein TadD